MGAMGFMGPIGLLFWTGVLFLLGWALYRTVSGSSVSANGESAMDVLERSYASGALTTEEYEERKENLRE